MSSELFSKNYAALVELNLPHLSTEKPLFVLYLENFFRYQFKTYTYKEGNL